MVLGGSGRGSCPRPAPGKASAGPGYPLPRTGDAGLKPAGLGQWGAAARAVGALGTDRDVLRMLLYTRKVWKLFQVPSHISVCVWVPRRVLAPGELWYPSSPGDCGVLGRAEHPAGCGVLLVGTCPLAWLCRGRSGVKMGSLLLMGVFHASL